MAVYCNSDVASNKISDKDISKIDQYRWTSLRNLHLCIVSFKLVDNGIGPVGLNYLSQARMESLEEFDLSYCVKKQAKII